MKKNTDPDTGVTDVIGYLLCGDLVDTPYVRGRKDNCGIADLCETLCRSFADGEIES